MGYKVLRNNELRHNYDPVYNAQYYQEHKQEAHEYYEAHKKLKGRSTAGLNDEGKEAAAYLKNKLNQERLDKNAMSKVNMKSTIDASKKDMQSKVEVGRAEMKTQIESHKTTMQAGIDRLNRKLKGMSAKEKRLRGNSIKIEIQRLRNQNTRKREELQAAFNLTKEGLKEEHSRNSSQAREEHKTNVATNKTEFDNKYADALDELLNDSRYKKAKKAKSSKSSIKMNPVKRLSEIKKIYKK